MTGDGTKLAHEFERRTAGFAVMKTELNRQKMHLVNDYSHLTYKTLNNEEVEPNSKPVLLFYMFSNTAKDHGCSSLFDVSGTLTPN